MFSPVDFLFVACAVVCVQCVPVRDMHLPEIDDDSQIVQSLIREVRAAPENVRDLIRPDTQNAFLRKYSDNDGFGDNDQGYNNRAQDEGGKGYKHFDSYHKKDEDKYGFEHHSAYGQANKDGAEGKGAVENYEEDESDTKENLKQDEDEEIEAGEETKKSYSVVEDVNEEYDDGAGSSGHYQEESEGEESEGDAGHLTYATEGEDDSDGGHYSEAVESDGGIESEHYTGTDGEYDDY